MNKELAHPWLLWMSLTLNLVAGPLLDKVMKTHRYSESARHSVSGITGYLAHVEGNRRAMKLANFIDRLTLDEYHCVKAGSFYARQVNS